MTAKLLQNRYELLEKIGDGGMAFVYRARCTLLDRIVAVKILKDEYANDAGFVLKFRSEAQAAARLSHPNIVNVYDVGEEDGLNFIVMEYVEGTNLKELIEREGPLAPDQVIGIGIMICDALSHAHDRGVIHRDIKPHNILITRDGTAKVADFGIAQAASTVTITYSGKMVGSVHYVSPEQARGEMVGKTTDIYSLGCVMYEMTVGRVPFEADSPVTVALKHIHEEVKPPSLLNEALPRSLEGVIMKALEKNPAYRFQSAREMKIALEETAQGRGKAYKQRKNDQTLVMQPLGGKEDVPVTRKRKMKPFGYFLILAALLGLVGGYLFTMRGGLFGQEVVVPKVVGMSMGDATKELEKCGLDLKVINRVHRSDAEKDVVVSQNPKADEKVKKGRQIEVTLSLGPDLVEVPNLVGRSEEDARLLLKNRGLDLGEIGSASDPTAAEGTIISQDPPRDRKVESGTKVDVVVSTGSSADVGLKMPKLVGRYISEARSLLESLGLKLDKIDKIDSSTYFPGQVIQQGVPAGQAVDKGAQVSVVVSKGPGPLPKKGYVEYTMPPSSDFSVLSVVLVDSKGREEIYNNTHLGGYAYSQQVEYYGQATVFFYVDGQIMEKKVLQ